MQGAAGPAGQQPLKRPLAGAEADVARRKRALPNEMRVQAMVNSYCLGNNLPAPAGAAPAAGGRSPSPAAALPAVAARSPSPAVGSPAVAARSLSPAAASPAAAGTPAAAGRFASPSAAGAAAATATATRPGCSGNSRGMRSSSAGSGSGRTSSADAIVLLSREPAVPPYQVRYVPTGAYSRGRSGANQPRA